MEAVGQHQAVVGEAHRRHGRHAAVHVEDRQRVQQPLLRRAQQIDAGLIVAERHTGGHAAPWLLRYTDWELLRQSPVPVLLLKKSRPWRNPALLAGLNPFHEFAKPAKLDADILTLGGVMAKALGGKLHAVHVYLAPAFRDGESAEARALLESYQSRARDQAEAALRRELKSAQMPPERLHFVPGQPVTELPRLVRSLGADIVVMLHPDNQYEAERLGEVVHALEREGVDFVNLGYQAGNEGVLKMVLTDFMRAFPVDARGQSSADLPILQGVHTVKDFPLLLNVSVGYPGSKEWVQYVVSASEGKVKMIAGTTGVQSPQMYPYYPAQLAGILAAIKGAAEYESLVNASLGGNPAPRYTEAQRRMAPQMFGHLLMVALIIVGNIIHFAGRRGARA